MLYRVLANLVLSVHTAFVAFAILGGLLALRWHWISWLHVPAVLWGAVVEFTGWILSLSRKPPLGPPIRTRRGVE